MSDNNPADLHAHDIEPFDDPYDYDVVADMFRSLSSPIRAAILHHIAAKPHTVSELVDAMQLSQPMISQHLKVLRDAKVAKAQRSGRTMVYSVADEHVCQVFTMALEHSVEPLTEDKHPHISGEYYNS